MDAVKNLVATDSVFYLWNDNNDEYKDDFKKIIKEREQRRCVFQHQSPQISYRPILVHYISSICIKKTLSKSCFHLAVYLLDTFMDQHNIIPEKLLLVSNVCLLLSAKLEENAQKVPKLAELNAFANNSYSMSDYVKLELMILQFYEYDINFPCAVHYVFYYMQEFLSFDDLNGARNSRTLFYDFYYCIDDHLNRIVEDIHYMQYYQPSKLAAAVIAAGRINSGLPQWNKQLEDLTEYKEEDLADIVHYLLEKTDLPCTCNMQNISAA